MRKIAIAGALLAVCGACAGAPARAPELHAYSWSPVPAECTHITPFLWIRQGSDPAEIARESLKMPEGHRALFSWDLHHGILDDPEDRCRTPRGEPTQHQGVWPEHGIAAVRARFEEFFRRFREAGGKMDLFLLDFEGGLSNWQLGGMDRKERWLAIQNDPRFPDLAQKLGFSDLLTVADWRSGRHYLKWNAVTAGLVDEAVNRAVFEPARRYFPNARCSNYGSVVIREQDAVPDCNGHLQWREGLPAGTHQSTALYNWIGQLARQSLDGKKPYGQAPFAGLLLDVNLLRAMRRSSPAPIHPWLAWQRYAGDGPGKPVATTGGTPYYRELAIHTALLGAEEFLFWNPHPWQKEQKPETLSMPEDEKLLDGILAELNGKLAGTRRKPLTLAAIPWNAGFIATALQVDQRVVWRITLAEGVKEVRGTLDGKPVSITPAPGEVGAWFTHPAGEKLELQGGPVGGEAHRAIRPVVTTPVVAPDGGKVRGPDRMPRRGILPGTRSSSPGTLVDDAPPRRRMA